MPLCDCELAALRCPVRKTASPIQHRLDRDWLCGSALVRSRAGAVVDLCLPVRVVPAVRPRATRFLDARGHAIGSWRAELRTPDTGRLVAEFDQDGAFDLEGSRWLSDSEGGRSHLESVRNGARPLGPPAGDYLLYVEAPVGSFALPAVRRVSLAAEGVEQLTAVSLGFGGIVELCATGLSLERPQPLRAVFLAGDDVASHDPGEPIVVDLAEEVPESGPARRVASCLLPPGAWRYELRSHGDELVDAGSIQVRAEARSRLEFDLKR